MATQTAEDRTTHLVRLWLDNEEGPYRYWRERAQETWDDHRPSELDGPDDDDWIIEHTGYVMVAGGTNHTLGCYDDRDEALKVIWERMEADQFWPNVWIRGERGDLDLLNADTGEFVNLSGYVKEASMDARISLAEEMTDAHQEHPLQDTNDVFSDLLGYALACVDWNDVADSRLEEIDGYETR